ncbi:MAG TPA: DUF814 domain-containing protein [Candidatus Acetothermia bacterium]|nr:DUF814 domain-containing protein [Candidatus Acetothermia bacterium]
MEGVDIHMALREAGVLIGARLGKAQEVGGVLFLRFFAPRGALALDPLGKGIHLTELRPPAPPRPLAFAAAVRKHLRGQRLLSLEQAGFDRLVRLRFPGGEILADFRPRKGNLLLLQGGRVVAATGKEEIAPADWGMADPLQGAGPGVRRALAARLGRSPTQEELLSFLGELLSCDPRGYLYRTEGGPVASFYPRDDLGEPRETFPHFHQALDRVLEENLFLGEARAYMAAIREAIRRKRRALERIRGERERAASWRELKEKADLILTRLDQIPRGKERVLVPGYDGRPVELTLDPALSPLEYAQGLYRRARKLRRALEELPKRERRLREEIAELEDLLRELQHRPYLAPYLEGELFRLGVSSPRQERAVDRERPRPREFVVEGFRILVGRSARENESLVRKAHPRDLWFHARGVPGAHVIVKCAGRPVPLEVMREAARLAAWHSRARHDTKVAVSYTEVRHLHKPRGAPPGAFVLREEEVMVVRPEGEDGRDT